MSVQEILDKARALTLEERKLLIKTLVDTLNDTPVEPKRRRSPREFRGLGAHLYDGMDAQEYVKRLRSEWDDRP